MKQLILILLIRVLFLTACTGLTTITTNSLEDVQKNPTNYLGKTITVQGVYDYPSILFINSNPDKIQKIIDSNGYYLYFINVGINKIPIGQIKITGTLKQGTYNEYDNRYQLVKKTLYYIEATDVRAVK